jgi:hypothetical protein
LSVADELLLVASTRSSLLPEVYSARPIDTVSDGPIGVAVGVFWGGGGPVVAVAVGAVVLVAVAVGGTGIGVGVDPPPGGCTVRAAVLVTPAPDTEIVTFVVVVTTGTFTMKPPVSDPWGTMTAEFTLATSGLLLERKRRVSDGAGDANLTVPLDPPGALATVGSSVTETGGCCGFRVTCDWRVAPFKLALTVTALGAVTALVGTLNEMEKSPGATVTFAGTFTRAGLLLARLTTVPPAGACPLSMTITGSSKPPVYWLGVVSDCSDPGCTVNVTEAAVPLSVAVSVTGLGESTAPTWNRNWSKANP